MQELEREVDAQHDRPENVKKSDLPAEARRRQSHRRQKVHCDSKAVCSAAKQAASP